MTKGSARRVGLVACALVSLLGVTAPTQALIGAPAGATAPNFTDIPLIAPTALPSGVSTAPNANSLGNSEPGITFAPDGHLVINAISWLGFFLQPSVPLSVSVWTGRFGSTPKYFGPMETDLQNAGNSRTTLGNEDAQAAVTSAGTLLLADLNLVINPTFKHFSLGVDVARCPAGSTAPADCTHAYLDTNGDDRPWITTLGQSSWVAYHDASFIIRVKRSTDDGRTWQTVGSPMTGQGSATGLAIRDNTAGPIVADPGTGTLFEAYASGGDNGKPTDFFDQPDLYVAHSTDGGQSWSTSRIYSGPNGTTANNIFPSVAVDPMTHVVYATWSDTHSVFLSQSTDGGATWSAPQSVSSVATSVMPNIAALNGKLDIVYYGSSAATIDDPAAVWNVYDSEYAGGSWTVKQVSNTPNRVGPVCLDGAGCKVSNRELLDLLDVAVDPTSGKAAIVYTDTTIDTWTSGTTTTQRLPEAVLAFEN